MTEMKPLTEYDFDEFVAILQEINKNPLAAETIKRLKNDHAQGLYGGFMLYEEKELVGIAAVVESYSVIHAMKILTLDEIYVRELFRQRGFGKILFENIIRYAKSRNFMRLEWRTEKGNAAAQALYSQYETDTDWTFYGIKI